MYKTSVAGLSFSGNSGRRAVTEALQVAAKKSKAVVVVAKWDRLFRSVADAANVIADFE